MINFDKGKLNSNYRWKIRIWASSKIVCLYDCRIYVENRQLIARNAVLHYILDIWVNFVHIACLEVWFAIVAGEETLKSIWLDMIKFVKTLVEIGCLAENMQLLSTWSEKTKTLLVYHNYDDGGNKFGETYFPFLFEELQNSGCSACKFDVARAL